MGIAIRSPSRGGLIQDFSLVEQQRRLSQHQGRETHGLQRVLQLTFDAVVEHRRTRVGTGRADQPHATSAGGRRSPRYRQIGVQVYSAEGSLIVVPSAK